MNQMATRGLAIKLNRRVKSSFTSRSDEGRHRHRYVHVREQILYHISMDFGKGSVILILEEVRSFIRNLYIHS
jgi:hypothetical protein